MNPQYDYASMWPELFRFLKPATRETVLKALRTSAETGAPPTEMDARLLIEFASGQISAKEFGRRTLAHLTGQSQTPPAEESLSAEPVTFASPVRTPSPVQAQAPASVPTPTPVLDHEAAALAFVRGEFTVEQYLQNARKLRRLA